MAREATTSTAKTKKSHSKIKLTFEEYGPAKIVAYEDSDYPEYPRTFLVELGAEFFEGSWYRRARVDNYPVEVYAMTRRSAEHDVTKITKTIERDEDVLVRRAVKVYVDKILRPKIDQERETARQEARRDLLSRPVDWDVTVSEHHHGEYSIGVEELGLTVLIGEDEAEWEQEQKQAVVRRMFDLIKRYGLRD